MRNMKTINAPVATAVNREEGSGTVLALATIATVLVLAVLALGVAGAYVAHRRAASAADLSALAAADALRGLAQGQPCQVAERIAEQNGAQLRACTIPERPESVDVRVAVPVTGPFAAVGDAIGTSRAGAPETSTAPETAGEDATGATPK